MKDMIARSREIAIALVIMFVVGCGGGGPSEDQLENLREAKAAALSAEEKVAGLKEEKRELERTLTDKRKELTEVETEKEAVAAQLEEMGRMRDSEAAPADTSADSDSGTPPGL